MPSLLPIAVFCCCSVNHPSLHVSQFCGLTVLSWVVLPWGLSCCCSQTAAGLESSEASIWAGHLRWLLHWHPCMSAGMAETAGDWPVSLSLSLSLSLSPLSVVSSGSLTAWQVASFRSILRKETEAVNLLRPVHSSWHSITSAISVSPRTDPD